MKNKQKQLKIKKGKKQVDALNTLKSIKDNKSESLLKYKKIAEELCNKRMTEIQDIAKQTDFNNLTFYL